ncbi:hypothetical protein DY000_02010115 [Brassica cretica]|uniref:Uncharacterized protein n=1 Tax=Brassica cretica TaxID=69181 RepID=A0ABQ7CBB9_BRACR|nr:hypothetical protein DY000_02010115 [Brassica cretica]
MREFGYVTDYQRDYKEYFGDASELTPILGYLQRLRTAHPDRLSWWRCRCSGDRNQVCRGLGMSGMEFFRWSCTACLYDEGRMRDCLDWPHKHVDSACYFAGSLTASGVSDTYITLFDLSLTCCRVYTLLLQSMTELSSPKDVDARTAWSQCNLKDPSSCWAYGVVEALYNRMFLYPSIILYQLMDSFVVKAVMEFWILMVN